MQPNPSPTARQIQVSTCQMGNPGAMFAVAASRAEFERLRDLWVAFTVELADNSPLSVAAYTVTCGNMVQFVQR